MARTDNKGSAELRSWELNSNSTRYDYLLAAPSDATLTKYWTSWAVISTLGGLVVAVILTGVLTSRNARNRPFNLYLIYLMIPDAIYSILCGIVCAIHAYNERQVAGLCNFQMMFIVWGVGSNMWLNAAVSHQLHNMLRHSDARQKYQPPTRNYVTRQAIYIYLFMIFLGTLGLIENAKFPHYVASTSGLACLPVEHDWKSSIFFWIVFFPLFGGIPIMYITYVCYDVWKKKLLPPAGKRRLLVIYFGRIVIVFLLMWVPYMVLLFMFTSWMPTWVHFMGGTLSHLQGAVSAMLCLPKPDIYFAVKRFVCCQYFREGDDGERELETKRQNVNSSSWLFTFSGRTALFARKSSRSGSNPDDSSRAQSSARVSRDGDVISSHFFCSGDVESSDSSSSDDPSPAVEEHAPDRQQQQQESSRDQALAEQIFLDSLWPDDAGNYRDDTVTDRTSDETETAAGAAENGDGEDDIVVVRERR